MKDLLSKLRAILATTTLREMADLANHLGFGSSEITALEKVPKSVDSLIVRGKEKSALVTDGLGEIRKDKYEMPYAQDYEDNSDFLFFTHLHDNRH